MYVDDEGRSRVAAGTRIYIHHMNAGLGGISSFNYGGSWDFPPHALRRPFGQVGRCIVGASTRVTSLSANIWWGRKGLELMGSWDGEWVPRFGVGKEMQPVAKEW